LLARHRLHVVRFPLSLIRKLDAVGIKPASKKIYRNLSYPEIAEHERARNEGVFTANGTFCVDTGTFIAHFGLVILAGWRFPHCFWDMYHQVVVFVRAFGLPVAWSLRTGTHFKLASLVTPSLTFSVSLCRGFAAHDPSFPIVHLLSQASSRAARPRTSGL
jgi:hypothetical protein